MSDTKRPTVTAIVFTDEDELFMNFYVSPEEPLNADENAFIRALETHIRDDGIDVKAKSYFLDILHFYTNVTPENEDCNVQKLIIQEEEAERNESIKDALDWFKKKISIEWDKKNMRRNWKHLCSNSFNFSSDIYKMSKKYNMVLRIIPYTPYLWK